MALVTSSASIRANGYEPPERGTAKPAASATPVTGPGALVLIRRGDTLDKLVTTHLGKLPLRADLLRQAVIEKKDEALKMAVEVGFADEPESATVESVCIKALALTSPTDALET